MTGDRYFVTPRITYFEPLSSDCLRGGYSVENGARFWTVGKTYIGRTVVDTRSRGWYNPTSPPPGGVSSTSPTVWPISGWTLRTVLRLKTHRYQCYSLTRARLCDPMTSVSVNRYLNMVRAKSLLLRPSRAPSVLSITIDLTRTVFAEKFASTRWQRNALCEYIHKQYT